MKVLVATAPTWARPQDYNHLTEGELVYVQEPCATDLRNPDGGCGCGRGFAGMSSHRGGVAAKVVETSLSEADVREALRASMEASGWLNPAWVSAADAEVILNAHLDAVRRIADSFPVGTVVRRRIWEFFADVAAAAGGSTKR